MNNRYLSDDVFFTSARGQKITLLERRYDKLVLYTEDNDVWRRFRQWTQLLQEVPYTVGDIKGPLKAVDLYFPMKAKKQLLKALLSAVPKTAVPIS